MKTVKSELDRAAQSAWRNEDDPLGGAGAIADYEFHPDLNLARHAGPAQYVKTQELPHAVELLAGARV